MDVEADMGMAVSHMTRFGLTVSRLGMENGNAYKQTQLLALLRVIDDELKQQTLSAYLNGNRAVPDTFIRLVEVALKLREEQRVALWEAWAHGQDDYPLLTA